MAKIAALAHHLVHHVLCALRQHGDTRSWETLRRVLGTHCHATQILPAASGQTCRLRQAGLPDEVQQGSYRTLCIDGSYQPACTGLATNWRARFALSTSGASP